jgi:hypothetical protein
VKNLLYYSFPIAFAVQASSKPGFIFNYALQPFKAYCAIWVRRSNFSHQASPRVSPRESTQRRKVKLWARNVRQFYLNADFYVTFRNLLHVVKLRYETDDFTSPPKEGMLRIFRPGANPRTWVPKASTLPLDHRSRISQGYCRLLADGIDDREEDLRTNFAMGS